MQSPAGTSRGAAAAVSIDDEEVVAAERDDGRETYPDPYKITQPIQLKQYFVNEDDTVPQKVVVQKNSRWVVHFRRAGPRQRVYFESDEVKACIVTCGGLCPGLNTVIRELVCGLSSMYNVNKIYGIQNGYKGFYSSNYFAVTPKSVNDIHKRGGIVLGTSRGGHDTKKIVDNIQDRGINQEQWLSLRPLNDFFLEIYEPIHHC